MLLASKKPVHVKKFMQPLNATPQLPISKGRDKPSADAVWFDGGINSPPSLTIMYWTSCASHRPAPGRAPAVSLD